MLALKKSLISLLFSAFEAHSPFSTQQKPRLFVDASTYNPDLPHSGQAVILVAHNEARSIYERVCQAMLSSSGVVVVDQGSTDGTSYFAAEAGAVVVLQEPGMSCEVVMQKAAQVARSLSQNAQG
ncbi:MAG: hypothetical protein EHM21_18545 [Chloroflexi bacterium]|nr:MAG: hypothetical protein EHM21_18545 [Chloroflexota bacterium]